MTLLRGILETTAPENGTEGQRYSPGRKQAAKAHFLSTVILPAKEVRSRALLIGGSLSVSYQDLEPGQEGLMVGTARVH